MKTVTITTGMTDTGMITTQDIGTVIEDIGHTVTTGTSLFKQAR
ncbi:MAG: hypothetical protein WB586_15615 [Chthoniobacterales bacterium]